MLFCKNKINNNHGNSFLFFLLVLMIFLGVGYVVYNNSDFQRAHRREISKFNFYLRDYKKSFNDYYKKLSDKIKAWEKDHPSETNQTQAITHKETRSFEQLIYAPQALGHEVSPEMIRHQPDEITVCAFNADFLLNSRLTDKEMVHLANIFRFCDLSSIAGLSNQKFLTELTTLLKILRYDASFESSPPDKVENKFSAFVYRNDKIQSLKPAKIYLEKSFSSFAYYKSFKAGDFDFTVATFYTGTSGMALDSIEPLENFYENVLNENPGIKDFMIFGDFVFHTESLSWDSASLLPTFAHSAADDKTKPNLIGNFWFKKNDLVEFTGKSGIININENLFASPKKHLSSSNKPLWTQFKVMADDD